MFVKGLIQSNTGLTYNSCPGNSDMVKSKVANTVINDPSSSHGHVSASHREWRSFMSSNVAEIYSRTGFKESIRNQDLEDERTDMRKLLKDIERLGSSTLTWKERKKLENKNVVALGGKPTKSHRVPLSVAKPVMKSRKKRELKKIEEEKLLGIFTKRENNSKAQKQRTEDRVLRATEGYFSKGVLNVKHLLEPRPAKRDDGPSKKIGKHKKGKGKGKSKGKRKRK